AYTKAWRDDNPLGELKAFSLSKEAIDAILETNDTANLKIYFGKNGDDVTLVYLGSDSSGKDLLTNNSGESNIYDLARPCPSECDDSSILNSD
ncbi:MAG: hypothetical protein KJO64_00035, partial [Bacteroidia bacterium]|nr:hypothetical protein [Bacteroidia bacterium]